MRGQSVRRMLLEVWMVVSLIISFDCNLPLACPSRIELIRSSAAETPSSTAALAASPATENAMHLASAAIQAATPLRSATPTMTTKLLLCLASAATRTAEGQHLLHHRHARRRSAATTSARSATTAASLPLHRRRHQSAASMAAAALRRDRLVLVNQSSALAVQSTDSGKKPALSSPRVHSALTSFIAETHGNTATRDANQVGATALLNPFPLLHHPLQPRILSPARRRIAAIRRV